MNAVSGELSASGDVEFREGEDVVTGARLTSVSYTHLTLPTSDLV